MRATYLYAPGDVRVIDVREPVILQPTDAIVRVVAACVCGSDLHPYRKAAPREHGTAMGHEFVGLIEDLGAEVTGFAKGDFVIAPFVWSDGTCDFCREGLQTSCRHGGGWGSKDVDGGQGEAVRVPFADGTLVKVPAGFDPALVPDLLTLSDVYSTGYHAAAKAGVGPGMDVTVIGDGAVGLLAVLSAKQLGAERIILMGHHTDRTDLGVEFGATDVVAERGEEGIARVKDLAAGDGTHAVLEAVGYIDAFEQALGVVRPGGAVSRVGVPQYTDGPIGRTQFSRNVAITGGVAPARAYIERLLSGVLDGSVHPGRVFDRELPLEEVAEGYRLMNDREALKVLIRP
jgi:threonine dehydrogenase-like Zn-dependent dehydrogenase